LKINVEGEADSGVISYVDEVIDKIYDLKTSNSFGLSLRITEPEEVK